MKRTLFALLGLALFGAIFAGIYYAPAVEEVERERAAFNLAKGEIRPDFIERSVPGGEVSVNITIFGGNIDVYVMDEEWAASTLQPGEIGMNLSSPFSYHAQWTRLNVTGPQNWTFISDGQTRLAFVLDNSDTYYNDTAPAEGDVRVHIKTRYLEEEERSLIFGYLAAIPSVLLVVLTIIKQARNRRSAVARTSR